MPIGAVLISVSLALSQTPAYTLRDHGYGASVSRGVPVYSLAFAGTYCAYPRRDGQAELTWVAGRAGGRTPAPPGREGAHVCSGASCYV